jgi:phosphatidate phosphatase APP1
MKNEHLKRRLSFARIIPFIGYGTAREVFISGLVVAEKGQSKPVEGQTRWENIKAMIRRYMNNEIEFAEVVVTFMDMTRSITTDKHGIFQCHFKIDPPTRIHGIWHKAYISLAPLSNRIEAEIMILDDEPEFGVISDIDDTILISYATQKLQKLMLMMLNNARTRMPFEGVSAFYHALQRGQINRGYNPVFYVSNSEWNLYDLLYEFIEFNRIPKGPLLLRQMALYFWRPWKIREFNKNHKKESIKKLFTVYNQMKFILIGDSGQKDPQVYSEIAKEFPGRVLAIYIRDIGIKQNLTKIGFIINRVNQEFKTEMLLVKDSETAAKHAIEKGYISGEYLEYIRLEKEKDKHIETDEKLI